VLLHPFPLHGATFSLQLSALALSFRVIAPDFPGFGRSAAPEGVSEMSGLAGQVLQLMDRLGVARAIVGGVSMGGYAALALLRLEPTRVAGLALLSTQARSDDEQTRTGRETTARRVLAEGMEILVESMVPRLLSPRASPELPAEVGQMIRENTPEGAAAALRGMALRPDSRELLARYAGPTLVVSGEDDAMFGPERAHEMAQLASGSEHVRVPRAGHLTHLEAPDAVNQALLRLGKRVAASAG
jgi:pimeloyl-ACP methyl ester carboxylesterase